MDGHTGRQTGVRQAQTDRKKEGQTHIQTDKITGMTEDTEPYNQAALFFYLDPIFSCFFMLSKTSLGVSGGTTLHLPPT